VIFFNNILFGNIFQFNWGLTVVHWYTVCQKVWVNYVLSKSYLFDRKSHGAVVTKTMWFETSGVYLDTKVI
jgi:hypothetical protein